MEKELDIFNKREGIYRLYIFNKEQFKVLSDFFLKYSGNSLPKTIYSSLNNKSFTKFDDAFLEVDVDSLKYRIRILHGYISHMACHSNAKYSGDIPGFITWYENVYLKNNRN